MTQTAPNDRTPSGLATSNVNSGDKPRLKLLEGPRAGKCGDLLARKLRAAAAIAAVCLVAAPIAAQPTITLTDSAITIDGVTAGDRVALLSVQRYREGYRTSIVKDARVLTDNDGDGSITQSVPNGIPPQSLWIAVDRATGEFDVAWPEEGNATELAIDLATALTLGANGTLSLLEVPMRDMHLAVVRTGVGAWRAKGSDGGSQDSGPPNDAAVTTELTQATPIGNSPVFDAVAVGDVLIAVGPKTLEFFAVRVEGGA